MPKKSLFGGTGGRPVTKPTPNVPNSGIGTAASTANASSGVGTAIKTQKNAQAALGHGPKDSIKRDYRQGVRKANRLYRRTRGDLRHLYGETGDYIRNQKGKNNRVMKNAKAAITNQGQQLQGQLATTTNGTEAAAMSALAALGLSGANGAFDQFGADAVNNSAVAGQSTNDSLAMVSSQNMAQRQISNLMLGMNRGARASAVGQAVNNHAETLDDLRVAKNQALNDLVASMQARRRAASYFSYAPSSYSSGGGSSSTELNGANQAQVQLLNDLYN